MIDVIIADQQELFRMGMLEILAGAADVCLIVQPRSPEQLLRALEPITPKVLILSTSFLPAFPKIEPVLKRSQTALLAAPTLRLRSGEAPLAKIGRRVGHPRVSTRSERLIHPPSNGKSTAAICASTLIAGLLHPRLSDFLDR